jgi:exopolyphosphatase / guanosine-5'-triphosphate,3'-diphosphate pyrophosphatase
MIFAIIDLGTNTFNLLIAESCSDLTFRKIFNTKIPVKLGEGAINSGYIADIPFQRGISALQQYQQYIEDYKVEQTYAFATSAIRTASNGLEFVTKAKKITGISISIINGDEEAELIYYGNRMAVKMSDSISLIMDIGGGSTEFILANKDTIFWKQSYLLGAARLLDKFKLSDPVTLNEIDKFNDYLKIELKSLFHAAKKHKPIELIGSSGAFDSVVEIINGEFETGAINDIDTEYALHLQHYNFISDLIKKSTLSKRYSIKGLIHMRVDMIVISILLIDFILKELNLTKVKVSTFSLKEGVISKKMGLKVS